MTRAARALAWELAHKHRLGFAGIGLYVIAIVVIRIGFFDFGETVPMEEGEKFAILVIVPVTIVIVYLLAVFTYGFSGDVGARQSMFPSRLFTLPVSSTELALWPMVFGTTLVAALWLITRAFLVLPTGVPVPFFWPAAAIAALLAWAQALTWLPYPLSGLRVAAAMLMLTALQAITLIALEFKVSEPVMLAWLAPHLPIAFLVARAAVRMARRGDTPDWTSAPGGGRRSAAALSFASPERAQAWFEWKRHGTALPVLVTCLLPFELALLWVTGETRLVYWVLLGVVITPPFMAAFAAVTIARPNQASSDAAGVSPFIATRPVSSASLIGAKLRMTLWSTLLAWLLVLVAVPIALKLSGTWDYVAGFAQRRVDGWGLPRAVVLLLIVIGAFMLTTWRMLVQTLYVGLAGRVWLTRTWLSLTLLALCLIGPAIEQFLSRPVLIARLWEAKTEIFVTLAALKIALGLWVTVLLYRSSLLSDRALLKGAATWSAATLALYGVFVWWIGSVLYPLYVAGAIAVLLVPLVRVWVAPLALSWNRHR